jgi:hypothetical protein
MIHEVLGEIMDRNHSRLIVILLCVIAAVLLFGREATFGSMQAIFWIGLALSVVGLIVWAIVALIRYMRSEVKIYRDEVRRDREEGRPWLHTYLAWPGIIGNFAVFGVAGYSRFVAESCRLLLGNCLQEIPYWWLPATLLLASIPVAGIERLVLKYRNRDA